MHGCGSASVLLVNAEVDSMGGVVEGGVGGGTKTSPRRAAIEKVQEELRQEYDVREEKRRELEFLEKGGNPLDFKFGSTASLSVQSTSLADQHPDQLVTSEGKGSFEFTASPHGDSVESSGRPGAPPSEPNTADNLMLFASENEFLEGNRSSVHPRTIITPSEKSSKLVGGQNANGVGDSAGFGLPGKAYRRRIRTRANRDSTRSSSNDAVGAHGGHFSSGPSRHLGRNDKELLCNVENQNDQTTSSNCIVKPLSPDGGATCKTLPSDSQLEVELDRLRAVESTAEVIKEGMDASSDANASKNLVDNEHTKRSLVDTLEAPIEIGQGEPESCQGREDVSVAGCESQPCLTIEQVENQATSSQMNGFIGPIKETKGLPNDGQNGILPIGTKGLDSESSCTRTSISVDGNSGAEICTNLKSTDSNGNIKEQTVASDDLRVREGNELDKEMKETKTDDRCVLASDKCISNQLSNQGNGFKSEEGINGSVSDVQIQVQAQVTDSVMEVGAGTVGAENKPTIQLDANSDPQTICPSTRIPDSVNSVSPQCPEVASLSSSAPVVIEGQKSPESNTHLASKVDEDSILEEARIIEAKRKRIAELSVAKFPVESRCRSHWDYVIEEMAWLANDFAQERLWKVSAASQLCHLAASTSRVRFQRQTTLCEQKRVAHSLAKAVMEFWHSPEESSKELMLQSAKKDLALGIKGYASRFMRDNSSSSLHRQAEAPATPERVSDSGILDISWEDQLTEENLFYTVPPGAIEIYRKSIESHLVKCEKNGSSLQEEVDTSACDAVTGFGSHDNGYEEDEGDTGTYDMAAFESSKSSRFAQKKRKNLQKAYGARSYEVGSESPYMQCVENKVVTPQSVVMGKRPATSLNVSFPTKRVRTASRPRIVSPFTAGTSTGVQMPSKTDASSGDTNSFQDDQSTLNGGSHIPNNLEDESVGAFEKQLPYDSAEVSTKPKKKKKPKHLGPAYEARWQVESNFQSEQRDYSRKRLDSHQLESNGSSGLFGQPAMKKPKRQSIDNSLDNISPIGGSVPSPVASQMSMPNPSKFIKMLGGRDRGKKVKGLKMPSDQPSSGSPWSLFEDQALVVLVHDMGPNWELVSDAINSTLQFKCIFRKPKECQERHKILMDGSTGDGADSAEDSGSSQPYPSTLPGIPKGSARQLFQRLQGPMEEDTLKNHFAKIFIVVQKHHHRKSQSDNQDPKQIQQPHSSHMLALSQVCPNNLNGGPVLTPLDLCDATCSDMPSLGYQGPPHNSGLAISNQGPGAQMLPGTSVNSSVQGSPNTILGNNFPSSSNPLNASVRDGRYGIPRSASLSVDEQQRMQQYNQMLAGRNIQSPNLPSPGSLPGTERGVRMLPGNNGMGIMHGINRSMPRPGFQGIPSSPAVNSGSMHSSAMVAMPSPANMHSGQGSSPGNSMIRPRDALHVMRPGQNPESQRQMMVSDMQMQVPQGNSQGAPTFGGLNPSFSAQSAAPPVSSYPLHQQSHPMTSQQSHVLSPNHAHLPGVNQATNPQHQAYAMRLAKERHLQQRFLQQQQQQQQQQQFAASNSLMPHSQSQSQHPMPPPLQNTSQVHPQTSSPLPSASAVSTVPQQQQKHQIQQHGLARNVQAGGNGLPNQMGKQRQRQSQPQSQQQFQQVVRHHPQQRQQSQSQQQNKILKGVGRGNIMIHQNVPVDPSMLNGISNNPGNQPAEKNEQAMHLMQSYTGSSLNNAQQTKPLVAAHASNQAQPQQKMYSSQAASSSSKHLQHVHSHPDNSNQISVQPLGHGPGLPSSHQASSPLAVTSSHQQHQLHQKLGNQTQPAVQRVMQQSRQPQVDQKILSNSSQIGKISTVPQVCNDAIDVSHIASSTGGAQWRVSEPLYDPGTPSPGTNMASNGTPSNSNSGGSESAPRGVQGLGQMQSSNSMPPVSHESCTQWPHQPSSPVPQPQPQPLQQLPLPHHSQQQAQLVQPGNGSSYGRPTDPGPE